MKKIPTLFVRDPDNPRRVTNEVTPGCEWVLDGEGTATRQYDGTCVWFDGAHWHMRRQVKAGDPTPERFLPVQHDGFTGKTVGWVPAEHSGFYPLLCEAYAVLPTRGLEPGTFELCGPKINGNPEGCNRHTLIRHSEAERAGWINDHLHNFDDLRDAVAMLPWEGIVWHHPDGRMAKLKRRDLLRSKEES